MERPTNDMDSYVCKSYGSVVKMSLWTFLFKFTVLVFVILVAAWLVLPSKDRPAVREKAIMAVVSTLVMIFLLAIMMSGYFYEPRNQAEQVIMYIVVIVGCSVIASIVALFVFKQID